MSSLWRVIIALLLLLGGLGGDWAPGPNGPLASSHACCCGKPAGAEDTCPCPKPENNRTPRPGACSERLSPVATQAALQGVEQGTPRREPRPEPAGWAEAKAIFEATGTFALARGRDPDLGRHLARLSTFRI